jgi:hypothetical protein
MFHPKMLALGLASLAIASLAPEVIGGGWAVLPTHANPTPVINADRLTVLNLLVQDKATNQPIAHQAVTIYSDNGIRCIKAPCPNNGKQWQGKTSDRGVVSIPRSVIQSSTSITVAGYPTTNLGKNIQPLGKEIYKILLTK